MKEKYSKFEITTCPVTRKGIPKYCSARSKFKTSRGTLPALRAAFISIVTYSHERESSAINQLREIKNVFKTILFLASQCAPLYFPSFSVTFRNGIAVSLKWGDCLTRRCLHFYYHFFKFFCM